MKKEAEKYNFNDIKRKVDYLLKREQLVRFINYLVHKLKYRSQTFYLACFISDIFQDLDEDNFSAELIAVTALVLTVKYDENDAIAPDLAFFKSLVVNKIRFSCEIEEILNCEVAMLKVLGYKLNYYTPYHFMNFFFGHGIVFKDEILRGNHSDDNEEESTHDLADYEKIYEIAKEALFLFLEEEDYLYYGCLEIACACISFSRSHFVDTPWDKRLEITYKIKFEEFAECYETINGRKKLQANKSKKPKIPSSSSNYLTNLPALGKNYMPKLHNLHSLVKEESTIATRENSRKPGSRRQVTKHSLDPISRHKNTLESSREKKQFYAHDHPDNLEKFLENKNTYKLAMINLNSNNQTQGDKTSVRENSVSKPKKPFSSNFHNLNIVPFNKVDYTSESSNKNHDFNEENLPNKQKKMLATKNNFERVHVESASSKASNIQLDFSTKYKSNLNVLSIAGKLNYNANFTKNISHIPPSSHQADYSRQFDKSSFQNNIPKYNDSSSKKRNNSKSKSKDVINFNSNFSQRKMPNIPSIAGLNNSNDKHYNHPETNLAYNSHQAPKKLEFDYHLAKPVYPKGEEPTIQIPVLKEMPIPSSNLYSGKNTYNKRIQSGFIELKSRQADLGRKDELNYLSHNN